MCWFLAPAAAAAGSAAAAGTAAAATATTAAAAGTAAAGMTTMQTAMLVGSTLLSAYGMYQQGQQGKAMNNYQAALEDQRAAEERDAAKAEAEKIRNAKEIQRGAARAALAGSGVGVGDGTAVVIDQDIAQRYEEDAFTTLLNGNRRARSAGRQASMYRVAGKNAASEGLMGAGTTVLGGAMKYASWK